MNVRTIQHPGIEIRETDLTEYRDTVTTNNAYVIGFADRGPIYDYSWVTTQSEFIKLYGTPQTEAEKYLFYAVQSILNNGGTPLVARMPYDNKQCKAYKALKIKYVAKKDKGGENSEYINWDNDSTVTLDANPLMPLSGIANNLNASPSSWTNLFNCYGKNAFDVEPSGLTVHDMLANLSGVPSGTTLTAFTINKKLPSDLGIPSGVITAFSTDENVSGLLETKIIDAEVSGVLNPLFNIYNDPYFRTFDQSPSGQAILDANLLQEDAIGYRYGVFLDSKECELSNEQYDDLVTTNNFNGANSYKGTNPTIKYGEDISRANFIIVDKQKSVVDGVGNNEGYFVTLIDPFDALKMQRLLVNPKNNIPNPQTYNTKDKAQLSFWGKNSQYNWRKLFKESIDTLDCLQGVKNADGIWVGEVSADAEKSNLLDSWSIPLSANYYSESISKGLMNLFGQIPLTDVASNLSKDMGISTIDKQYSSHIVVAVCKTVVNPSDGKITVSILESFFGSLFNERDIQNGRTLYIGDIINANSNYIEFYRNNYVKPKFGGDYAVPPYDRKPVSQFFIKDSLELKNAVQMVGIDTDKYNLENPEEYKEYLKELQNNNIFVFDKKTTVLYNNHPKAAFCSFAKKEAQKIIANTTGLYGQAEGTTTNIGDNFIIDMDRCIQFIKNVDDIPMYFVVDAGLSTIAQFCDNVVWDDETKKWVTQQFDPDNDPDMEDRAISDYTDVSTWRKVVDKLDQISREIRRDCMTIIDAPRQLTLDGAAPKIRRSKPANNFDELIGEKLIYISGINSSYTAGYYNWLRTTDTYTGKSFWLPPTCKVIGNLCYLNIINLPWLAPAGLSYGIINGIHGVSHNPGSSEEDVIYQKSWNYIKQYPFDGFVIEGQKTTLTKNSAFNRINVRLLFLDLERFVYNVARSFKYQVNNQYTREQFVQTIKPKFEDYMIRGGLYDYLIKCDNTNNTPETIDQQELRCAIYLKPARLIEFILVDFIATKSGANFEEIVT